MNFTQVVELIALTTTANLICFTLGHVLAKPWLDRRFMRKPKPVVQPQLPLKVTP